MCVTHDDRASNTELYPSNIYEKEAQIKTEARQWRAYVAIYAVGNM